MLSPFPKHASLWWRSSIRIEGTRLVPVPPFVPYNPFDSYFPIETATREQRSLPYLFLDVNYEDIEAVATEEAARTGLDKEKLLPHYKRSDTVRDRVLSGKIMTFLKHHAKISEKELKEGKES